MTVVVAQVQRVTSGHRYALSVWYATHGNQ
jgi:hypothetical protein